MVDRVLQRKNMVESQIRPSSVTDRRIMAAMTDVARETFVPASYVTLAYMDSDITLSAERGMMAPRTLARLIQLADIPDAGPDAGRVLVVGAGLGYATAVLSRIAGTVVALECDEALYGEAGRRLNENGFDGVKVVLGNLAAGHAAAAPYNAIVVDGMIPDEPTELLRQLADGGRLVAVMPVNGVSRAVCFSHDGTITTRRVAFEASAPSLPGFAVARPAFTF